MWRKYKRVCGTIVWYDYNVGNSSAMLTGDLRAVEDEKNYRRARCGEDGQRRRGARQLRFSNLETSVIFLIPLLKNQKVSK